MLAVICPIIVVRKHMALNFFVHILMHNEPLQLLDYMLFFGIELNNSQTPESKTQPEIMLTPKSGNLQTSTLYQRTPGTLPQFFSRSLKLMFLFHYPNLYLIITPLCLLSTGSYKNHLAAHGFLAFQMYLHSFIPSLPLILFSCI